MNDLEKAIELVSFICSNGAAQDLLAEMGIEVSGVTRQNEVKDAIQGKACQIAIKDVIRLLIDCGEALNG